MNRKHEWLIALAVVALLVAACGPQMATPTPKATEKQALPTARSTAVPATAAAATATQIGPTVVPVDVGRLPVDPSDFHALGLADAPVTVIEYSDFQ